MKPFALLMVLAMHFQHAFTQAPHKFNYQAVARDQSGAVITGDMDIRLSFLEDIANGPQQYSETHAVTTNTQGVFDLIVGEGSPVAGDMSLVQWSKHEYWLKIEMKAPGDADFTEMGVTRMLSVPYAMYAAESGTPLVAGDGIDIINNTIHAQDESPDNEIQTLSINGQELSLSNGGGSIQLPSGGSDVWSASGTTITNSPNAYNVAIGSTNNYDSKLYVAASGNSHGGNFAAPGTGKGILAASQNGIGGLFSSVNGTAGYFNSTNGHALVTENGNVGLGVTNPARQLHVSGSTLLTNPDNGGVALEIGAGKVGIGITAPLYKFEVNGTSYFNNFNGPSLLVGNGNVGIGTVNPSVRLQVEAGNAHGIYATSDWGYGVAAYVKGSYPAGKFESTGGVGGFFYSSVDFAIHARQGNAGTATSTQGIELQESGSHWKMYIDAASDYNFAYNSVRKAWIYDGDGSYHNSSDRNLKKNIHDMSQVLPKLRHLQAYTYHMNDAPDDSPVSLGFMAQDVEQVFPELVTEKEGSKGLCYDHFAVLSVQAINEQQALIESLTRRVDELQALLETMSSEMIEK